MTGPLDWVEAGQRREGWLSAHGTGGSLPGPEVAGDWSAHSGYEAGLLHRRGRRVSAVFAANDAMALGLLRALHERGREVPGEVRVVGFDDMPEAGFFWPAADHACGRTSRPSAAGRSTSRAGPPGRGRRGHGLVRPELVGAPVEWRAS